MEKFGDDVDRIARRLHEDDLDDDARAMAKALTVFYETLRTGGMDKGQALQLTEGYMYGLMDLGE